MTKKVPLRTCIVTKEKLPKHEMIRVVMYKNEIKIDETGKANGRGCYIKKDKDVVNKALKNKVLNKAFKTNVNDNVYEELLKLID